MIINWFSMESEFYFIIDVDEVSKNTFLELDISTVNLIEFELPNVISQPVSLFEGCSVLEIGWQTFYNTNQT